MALNMTLFTNYTGEPLMGVTQAVNTNSEGIFGFMLLLGIYIITFVIASRYGTKTAFTTSAFIGAIFAIILRLMVLINDVVLYGCIVAVVVAVVMVWFSRD